jgi:3'(2'), 5'-bisphosphate nucleotidase/myo-inositol-1(or 4)-monophosphatase
MRLSAEDLKQLAECAGNAVREAGALIAQTDTREVLVQHKAGGESLASQLVTEVDELSQAIILKHLLPTCATYDLALLAEEQPDDGSRLEKDAFWCIDPLDGTLPFTQSIPGYAVSIALVARDGTPLIGVVYDPSTGTHYQAVQGQGALRDGEHWTLQPSPGAAPLSFISDRSITSHPQFDAALAQLQALASELGQDRLQTTLTGGAVMNALWVLERAPACYFKFPKPQAGGGSLWDYAATACIYAELGAWCSDVGGQRLDLNRADSTFMNHRGVLVASGRALGQALLAVLADLSDGE